MGTATPAPAPTVPPGDRTAVLQHDQGPTAVRLAPSSPTTAWVCLMCPRPVPAAISCCSAGCVLAADRELQHNLQALRRLGPPGEGGTTARHLAERTGHLSSAVLRRAIPQLHQEDHHTHDPHDPHRRHPRPPLARSHT
jgi:hypothetical protein